MDNHSKCRGEVVVVGRHFGGCCGLLQVVYSELGRSGGNETSEKILHGVIYSKARDGLMSTLTGARTFC